MLVKPRLTRRSFGLTCLGGLAARAAQPARKTVAAIVTEYRYRSHADVIVGRILDGYHHNNARVEPATRIVSMYTDQIAEKDMSRDLAAKHGFRIFPTVAEALTLGGGRLAVDAVLLIGEHGKYPTNEKGQKLYPRFELFQQVAEVFRRSRRVVPLFSDKHLSYSWAKARRMYEEARRLRIPFMAGSSIPLTVRTPALELPLGAPIERAVAVGYGGLDAYGFHTLEAMQCMVERRAGAEQGIAAVEALSGEAVWRWRDSTDGRWSAALLEAALSRRRKATPGPPERNAKDPVVFLLEYRDGFRAAAYMLDGYTQEFLFAAKLKNSLEPVSTMFGLPEGGRPLPHFDGLVHSIERMFVTGRPVYPVERTLLVSGALDFLLESKFRGKRLETPELNVKYLGPSLDPVQKA